MAMAVPSIVWLPAPRICNIAVPPPVAKVFFKKMFPLILIFPVLIVYPVGSGHCKIALCGQCCGRRNRKCLVRDRKKFNIVQTDTAANSIRSRISIHKAIGGSSSIDGSGQIRESIGRSRKIEKIQSSGRFINGQHGQRSEARCTGTCKILRTAADDINWCRSATSRGCICNINISRYINIARI